MKKYNVVYTDPPWNYGGMTSGRSHGSSATKKYKTVTLDDLKEMPVNEITDENALCFMWATVPLMDDAFNLMAAWGFNYKTLITWEKTGGLGMGSWVRIQTEHLLIGVKGKVLPFGHQEKNIYKHPLCKHSAKPHFFRELVMKLAAKSLEHCERLEMFARTRDGMFGNYEYEGWDVFGNEVENSIIMPKNELMCGKGQNIA